MTRVQPANPQPRHRRWKLRIAVVGTVVVATFLANAYLLDGVVGWFWTVIGAAPTEFAAGYSERSFRRIKKGMNAEEVRRILGIPLSVFLRYSDGEYLEFDGLSGRAVYGYGLTAGNVTMDEVRHDHGEPKMEIWNYGRSPTTSPYSVRAVVLEHGQVADIIHTVRWE